MSEEGRRVFKMEAILALFAGKSDDSVSELLGYLSQRDLSAAQEAFVSTLAKAWLYSQHQPFMECAYNENTIYSEWIRSEVKRLGDNVSLAPLPEDEMAKVNLVLDTLSGNAETIAEQKETIAGLEAKVAELEPYKELEKKVAELEKKVGQLEEKNTELNTAAAEYAGKIPVAEGEINTTIKDIVTKALKDAVASVPLGAAAGGGEGGEAAAAAPEADDGSTAAPPDDFGFGSSGSDGGGFGF